jgi:hypothetical protein
MSNFINSLPDFAIYYFFPFISLVLLIPLVYLFRKLRFTKNPDHYDTDVLDTATQNSISAAYVILGFTLVLVMGTADSIDNNLVTEASRIESLDRLLFIEGSKQAEVVRKDLYLYTKSIVEDEWPLLVKGSGSNITNSYLLKLFDNIRTLKPADLKSAVLFNSITSRADEVALSRESRIMAAKNTLPPLFWNISFALLLGVLIISAMRLSKTTPLRAVAVTVQIMMLCLIYTSVMIIDQPYRGETRASPEIIIKTIKYLENNKTAH